jgi:acetoin utilization protein AcuB
MLVKNWMSKPAITIQADAAIKDTIKLLKEHKINMLPVMKNDQLVGVVTDQDLKRASASDLVSFEDNEVAELISRIKVKTVMTKKPIAVPYNYTIEEAALLMFVHNISGAPVVNQEGKLVGVVTKTDLFKVIISLTGISKKGIQIALRLKDRSGAIQKITDLIRENGGRIASILSIPDRNEEGHLNVYIRVYGIDQNSRDRIKELLKEKASPLYIIDHLENRRDI